jgi:hypothetical protein
MMDTKICNKLFPFEWRSSLAISVYEPKVQDLPEELCDRITYIKITCSITGYQPTVSEKQLSEIAFPDVPTERLSRIIGQYFACYGTLLNVVVAPPPNPLSRVAFENPRVDLKDYPHIIDFEPKTRDLYQTATEEGEILTASRSELNTSKGLTSTETTETGLSVGGALIGAAIGGMIGGPAGGGTSFTSKWGETAQNSTVTTVDESRERREKHATNTTLSQMYSLLTSYHAGTNRATFLMLPRPHILQPTDYRTFVQGVKAIEGVQEFFLIVARPKEMKGLSIEAFLETGHFPEGAARPAQQEYETRSVTLRVGPIQVHPIVRDLWFDERGSHPLNYNLHGFEVDGWEFDPRGDAGIPGICQTKHSDDNASGNMENYSYAAIKPDSVQITGTIFSGEDSVTTFHRDYQIFLRRPKSTPGAPEVDIGKMIITSRGLCTGFISGDPCPTTVLVSEDPRHSEAVVDERTIIFLHEDQ